MPPRAGAADYMPQPLDILDQRDPLAGSFVGALAIHVCAIALLFFGWYWANRPKEMLGDPHPAGGPAYSVSPVHNIPIPKRDAPLNPVANDTQSTVPTAPAKQEVEKPPPPPQKDAFELPEKIKRLQPFPTGRIESDVRHAVGRGASGHWSEFTARLPVRGLRRNHPSTNRREMANQWLRCTFPDHARRGQL
jgi:hypothetical protein